MLSRLSLLLAILSCGAVAHAQDARPQLALQMGHVARVNALVPSPDGSALASGGSDKTAKIWDAKTGALRFSLPHDSAVLAVGWANNVTLVTADAKGVLRRFNVVTGAMIGGSEGGRFDMSAAAFSGDGRLVALARSKGQIEIRDVLLGKLLSTLDGHPTRVLGLAFSPDSKTLASCSDAFQEKAPSEEIARRAGDVRLWDLADGDLIRVLRGHALAVRDVAWSHNGSKLASVGESGTAVVWNAQTFARIDEFNISEGQGRALTVAFSPDGSQLAAGWRAGVRLFDLKNTSNAVWSRRGEGAMPSVAFLSDGRVVTSNNEGSLQFLDAKNGAPNQIQGRIAPLNVARISADGNYIVCAGTDGALCLWNAKSGALLRAWRAHEGSVRDIAFIPKSSLVASAGDDGQLRLWELPSGKLKGTLGEFKGPLTALAASADGTTLAVGNTVSGLGTVSLWEVATGKSIATLNDARGTVYSLAFGNDGSLVAAAGNSDLSGDVLIWNAAHKLRARNFLRGAHSVAISKDGKRLVGAGAFLDENQDYIAAGDAAQIWSLRAGEVTRELTATAPEARGLAAAFAPDSKKFAIASHDGSIRIWDGSDDAPVRTLIGHEGPVNGVFFAGSNPVAPVIVSAGNDGTVRLWEANTGRNLVTLLTLLGADQNVAIGSEISPDWLALTPEGYFAGSPAAGRFVQWRLGNDVFPVDAFEGAFRSPDLIGAALRGEKLDQLKMGAQFTTGKAVPPQVTISLPKAGQSATTPLTVQVQATDDKNLKSVQLFVNGRRAVSQNVTGGAKPLEVGAKPLELGAKPLEMGAKPLELGAKPLEVGAKPIDIGAKPLPAKHGRGWNFSLVAPLPPADGGAGVTVKALVTDSDGLQGADEIRLLRKSTNGGSGTLRVLAIGVSSYANPAYNLKYASSDAASFAALWKPQTGRLFEKIEVATVTDTAATSGAVLEAMRKIARDATPNDVVAIFLSGHGIARTDSEFFFATHNVDLTKLDQTALPWTALQEVLGGSKARRVVLFLDACHSGGALGARQAGNEAMASQLVKNAGAIVFSSSLGTQNSYEIDALKHGAFTQALMDGIGKGEADLDAGNGKDGIVNVEELLTFLRARVPKLTNGAQMPACPLLQDFGEPFPLAKVK